MSFSENLKQIRKEYNLSQEELAEMLDVSRQAVSKWEQGQGYPEVEKLLLLSSKLNISLDSLMSGEVNCDREVKNENIPGLIVIISPHENVIATCSKVSVSSKMHGGKGSPQYALFGFDGGSSNFWGGTNTFLGWYASEENISKEIGEIHRAILQGIRTYTLQYSAKTQRHFASIKIVEE